MGYGDSGWAPFTFFLREGQNVGVGVVKLFLSTERVNLSHVAQLSPFLASVPEPGPVVVHSTAPPLPPSDPTGGPSSTTTSLPFDASLASPTQHAVVSTHETSDPKMGSLLWDTVEITVVQRRESV